MIYPEDNILYALEKTAGIRGDDNIHDALEKAASAGAAWAAFKGSLSKGLKGAATQLGKGSGGKWGFKMVDGKKVRYLKPLAEGSTFGQQASHLGARVADVAARNPGTTLAATGVGVGGLGAAIG